MTGLFFILTLAIGDISRLNFYFFINICTVAVLTWFIRRSFNVKPKEERFLVFRISLFLLLNSSFVSMAGGLNIIERDASAIIADLIYIPAILMVIYSFNKFISYVNQNYKSAVNLSLTDELTGLPNRRHLNIKLREMENKCGAICIADIDHFKRINDTYGHETGDNVLINTGLILSDFASDNIFISRSGGEEFAILIFDNISTLDIIRKIKRSVSDDSNASINVTLSIGVAIKQKHNSSSTAITAADDALYKAKKEGRDCIILSPPLRDH